MTARQWFMRFDAAAWIASTMTMSAEESGAHMNMIAWSWLNGPVPDDDEVVDRITRAGELVGRRVLEARWTMSGDSWTNDRLERERAYCRGRSGRSRDAAAMRWQCQRISDGNANAYANALPNTMRNACVGNAIQMPDARCQNERSEGECEGEGYRLGSEPRQQQNGHVALEPEAQDGHTATQGRSKAFGWSREAGWSPMPTEAKERIVAAFPGIDLDTQLARMSVWLSANPTRARKKNWMRFITNWLGGDTRREPARTRSDY